MSWSSNSKIDNSARSWGACAGNYSNKGHWTAPNIAAMVLGFVLFWPIGLFILYWICKGRDVSELVAKIRHAWSSKFGKARSSEASDNSIFNAFQQTQYDRINEIKDEIRERAHRFNEFREDAKRRADEDEFNRFMASTPKAPSQS